MRCFYLRFRRLWYLLKKILSCWPHIQYYWYPNCYLVSPGFLCIWNINMIILTCLPLLLLYFSVIWNSQTKAIYCRFRNFDWLTKITHILDGDVDLKRPKRLRDISFLVLSLWNWNLAQYLWFMVLKKLRKHSIIMNSKWFYITIVAYGYYTPVFWFLLRRNDLNHYPTEFTAKNRELFSDQWTTQDRKFLFFVQATSCKSSNIDHLSEHFALTHTE